MPSRKGAAVKRAKPPPRDNDLADIVRDLALLTAANNVMAQTAFLTVERLRISTEVVDEAIPDDFGAQLFRQCETLAKESEALVARLVERTGGDGPTADALRDLVAMRRVFAERAARTEAKPLEQRRLLESMERMYR